MMRAAISLFLILGLLTLGGCADKDTGTGQAKPLDAKKTAMKAKWQAELDGLDESIKKLEAAAAGAPDDAKKKYEGAITKLKDVRKQFNARMEKIDGTAEDKWEAFADEADDASDKISKTIFETEKSTFKEVWGLSLAAIDKKMTMLDEKAKKATGDAKTKLDEAIAKLKTQRTDVGDQLEEIDDTPEEEWDDLKENGADALKKLSTAVDAAWKEAEG